MNFLAHAVLAGNNAGVIAGSLAGDFVKGVLKDGDYPADFLLGIRLHRRLDAFSNSEPALRRSAGRLPDNLRRIAPPCIDVLADHFLAEAAYNDAAAFLPRMYADRNGEISLENYEASLHSILASLDHLLTDDARRFFNHASATRLFSDYRNFDRAARGIAHVCERLDRATLAERVTGTLLDQRSELQADFSDYWPALVGEARRFLGQAGVAT